MMGVPKQWQSAQGLLLDLSHALYKALSEEKQKLRSIKDKAEVAPHAARVKELKAAWKTLQEAVTSARCTDTLRIRPLAAAVKHAQLLVWQPGDLSKKGVGDNITQTTTSQPDTHSEEQQHTTNAQKNINQNPHHNQQHSNQHQTNDQRHLPHQNHHNQHPPLRASLGPMPSPLPPGPPPSSPPCPPPVPPPPAPPPWPGMQRPGAIANTTLAKGALKRISTVVVGYQALVRGASGSMNSNKSAAGTVKSAGDKSSMLKELALKSKHRQQILMDVELHHDELQSLARDISNRKLAGIDELQALVKATDNRLDKLADECAVLKEIECWPDKRYEAMRLMSTTDNELMAATKTVTHTATRLSAACSIADVQVLKEAQEAVMERVEGAQTAWPGLKKLGDEHQLPTAWHPMHVKNLKEAALSLLHTQLKMAADALAHSSASSSSPSPAVMSHLRPAVSAAYKIQNILGGLDARCEAAYAPIFQALQKGLP